MRRSVEKQGAREEESEIEREREREGGGDEKR